jgi:hypothetical protein
LDKASFILNFEGKALKIKGNLKKPAYPAYRRQATSESGKGATDADRDGKKN